MLVKGEVGLVVKRRSVVVGVLECGSVAGALPAVVAKASMNGGGVSSLRYMKLVIDWVRCRCRCGLILVELA